MSIGLKKVATPGGRLFGVIDKLIMSTPSCAAYKCNIDNLSIYNRAQKHVQ